MRMLILFSQARRELTRRAGIRAQYNRWCWAGGVVDNRMIFAVLLMLVYGGTIVLLSMVLMLTDLDPVTAFSAAIASVHCLGPGLGSIGPTSSYATLDRLPIWGLYQRRVVGAVEILSFIALTRHSGAGE